MHTRRLLICLLGLFLSGCLGFQTRTNPLKLKPSNSISVGPQSWRIHYRETGRAGQPAVVMIHGYGSASVVWVPLMRVLAKRGYHCLALDLPGFGLSDKRKGNYKTSYISTVVASFLKKKGIAKADVIAHSWGSSVALSLALQRPAMVRRIVINSGWVYNTQIVPVIRWARMPLIGEMMYGMFYREMPGEKLAHSVYDARKFATQKIVEVVKKAHDRPGALAAALAVARGMDLDTFDSRYKTIRQKTLLQWGKQDRIALPFYGRRLVSDMPNARLVFLERCGHMPMMERPYAFIRNIARFLGHARKLNAQVSALSQTQMTKHKAR